MTKTGVFAGMIIGVATVAFLVLSKRDPFYGLNAGFFALCLNAIITVLASSLKLSTALRDTARRPSHHESMCQSQTGRGHR